jgi:ElaB/YqjD/DUF883 family membrane-anchored ribosome-binding protein
LSEKEEKEFEEMRKIEDYVMDLRKDVDKRLSDLSEQLGPVRKRAARAVTRRPLLALGVAFTVGVMVGMALSNLKD